jgi:hypothetical protein
MDLLDHLDADSDETPGASSPEFHSEFRLKAISPGAVWPS